MVKANNFDSSVIQFVQNIGIYGFGHVMAAATFMGNASTLIVVGTVVGVVALIQHQDRVAAAIVASELAMIAYNGMKLLFNRERPDTLYAATQHSTSFPSGHAADSVAIYGLIGYLMWSGLPAPYSYLGLLVGIALPFLVGLSRVYLGAHYPTDVLGGWVLGTLGLVLIIRYVLHQ